MNAAQEIQKTVNIAISETFHKQGETLAQ